MRITQKVSLALGAAFIVVCALLWAALQMSVAPKFAEFEYEKASDNFGRAQNAVERELQLLEAFRSDYGVWDDAYEYMKGGYPGFLERQLPFSLFNDIDLSVFVYLSPAGGKAEGVAIDGARENQVDVDYYAPSASGGWESFHARLAADEVGQSVIQTKAGLMMIAYGPVTLTDGGGDYVGHLLTGTLVNDAFVEQLSSQTREVGS